MYRAKLWVFGRWRPFLPTLFTSPFVGTSWTPAPSQYSANAGGNRESFVFERCWRSFWVRERTARCEGQTGQLARPRRSTIAHSLSLLTAHGGAPLALAGFVRRFRPRRTAFSCALGEYPWCIAGANDHQLNPATPLVSLGEVASHRPRQVL